MALSVIVVDDEENILNDMERMLKQTVGVVLGGAFSMPLEALKFAHKYRVDVAILDINMPGLNGMELGEMLRSIHPDIQIIFATGYDEYAIRAYQMDAMAYLLKPCTFMDLQKSLDRVKTMVEGMKSVSAAENHCFSPIRRQRNCWPYWWMPEAGWYPWSRALPISGKTGSMMNV